MILYILPDYYSGLQGYSFRHGFTFYFDNRSAFIAKAKLLPAQSLQIANEGNLRKFGCAITFQIEIVKIDKQLSVCLNLPKLSPRHTKEYLGLSFRLTGKLLRAIPIAVVN
mmetsp:Transcript_8646/g.21266  ORF Transcript_8646/g.21266 Transcript_8646/m.21266 type:complete len:111 (-) Transcript_8646:1493-1825(-)